MTALPATSRAPRAGLLGLILRLARGLWFLRLRRGGEPRRPRKAPELGWGRRELGGAGSTGNVLIKTPLPSVGFCTGRASALQSSLAVPCRQSPQ